MPSPFRFDLQCIAPRSAFTVCFESLSFSFAIRYTYQAKRTPRVAKDKEE